MVRVSKILQRIFEHNAGFIDLICLIILLELFLPIFISWVVFLAFLLYQVLLFFAILYMVARGGWVEKNLNDTLEKISKELSDTA